MKRTLSVAAVVAVLAATVAIAALAGCGPSAHPQVDLTKTGFNPAQVTVKVGGTVTWTNHDTIAHTVSASDLRFDSSTLYPGKTFSYEFDTAGTYDYYCRYNPTLKGTVTVK